MKTQNKVLWGTLGPGDNDTGVYDLPTIATWNQFSKYFPLTAMLICPVITIFYIDLFGNYNLKMSKIMIFYIKCFGDYNLKMS